ncbi:MAG: MAPEG family protein, partial [Gammaproteobacteria bacterium]
YMTHTVSETLSVLAWIYVALRIVHSLIHVTYNKIIHRFSVYATSSFLLLAMWIIFAVKLYRQA